jgi:antitoxin CptB
MTTDTDPRRLRWLCRRGMKELDIVLGWYLDECFPSASDAERGTFISLLDLEDPVIWQWLVGAAPLPDGALGHVVQRLIDRR